MSALSFVFGLAKPMRLPDYSTTLAPLLFTPSCLVLISGVMFHRRMWISDTRFSLCFCRHPLSFLEASNHSDD